MTWLINGFRTWNNVPQFKAILVWNSSWEENVFEAYHSTNKGSSTKDVNQLKRISSVHLQQLQKEQDPMIIGQIVSEIVDQIHSFNYRCLGNTKTQSQPSSSPSIARSEGDGLSSPEPPVLSHSVRAQCTN